MSSDRPLVSAHGDTRAAPARANEDALLVLDAYSLYAVADGVGSRPAASIASGLAVDQLRQRFTAIAPGLATCDALLKAVEAANNRIYSTGLANLEMRGMATTLSALALAQAAGCVAHVGDTRIYLLSRGEALRLLTEDHTSARALMKSHPTTTQRASHPLRRHLLRALGLAGHVECDIMQVSVRRHDRFLLCSDGLVEAVSDADIETTLRTVATPRDIVENLLTLASARGAKDDVTTVVVEVL